jgi:hypothetical protein
MPYTVAICAPAVLVSGETEEVESRIEVLQSFDRYCIAVGPLVDYLRRVRKAAALAEQLDPHTYPFVEFDEPKGELVLRCAYIAPRPLERHEVATLLQATQALLRGQLGEDICVTSGTAAGMGVMCNPDDAYAVQSETDDLRDRLQ